VAEPYLRYYIVFFTYNTISIKDKAGDLDFSPIDQIFGDVKRQQKMMKNERITTTYCLQLALHFATARTNDCIPYALSFNTITILYSIYMHVLSNIGRCMPQRPGTIYYDLKKEYHTFITAS